MTTIKCEGQVFTFPDFGSFDFIPAEILQCKDPLIISSLVKKIVIFSSINRNGRDFQFDFSVQNLDNNFSRSTVKGVIYRIPANAGPRYLTITEMTKYGDERNRSRFLWGETEGDQKGSRFSYKYENIEYIFVREPGEISSEVVPYKYKFLVEIYPFQSDSRLLSNNLLINKSESEIFIKSQLLIDFSDIGNTKFKVIEDNNKIIYEKDCPKIVNVLKGIGLNAWKKLNDIYIKYNIEMSGITGFLFLEYIIEYSMVRYLFTKLLYDKFMMQFLLQKNYHKFLLDLKNSKYSSYYDYFTEGKFKNYYQYFLINYE